MPNKVIVVSRDGYKRRESMPFPDKESLEVGINQLRSQAKMPDVNGEFIYFGRGYLYDAVIDIKIIPET